MRAINPEGDARVAGAGQPGLWAGSGSTAFSAVWYRYSFDTGYPDLARGKEPGPGLVPGSWIIPGSGERAGAMLIGLGLMFYNARRFDSPFEFGWHYQLNGDYRPTTRPSI